MSEEAIVDVVEEVTESVIDPEIIAEAERFGWVDKEKFRGNESDWVDAETFVKRGREINPILKANNERLKKEIETLKQKQEETEISVKEFKKYQQEALDRKVQEYKDQINELKTAKKEAISVGDGERVIEIDDQIDELKEAQRQAAATVREEPKKQQQEFDPIFLAWKEENEWYNSDLEMQEEANLLGDTLFKKGIVGQPLLIEVTKRIKKMYPEKFETRRASPVDTSTTTRTASSTKKKTYENLPPEGKKACDDFVRRGWLTKEEYVANYDWN